MLPLHILLDVLCILHHTTQCIRRQYKWSGKSMIKRNLKSNKILYSDVTWNQNNIATYSDVYIATVHTALEVYNFLGLDEFVCLYLFSIVNDKIPYDFYIIYFYFMNDLSIFYTVK